MPRGGKREGTPGKGYSNRTDLAQNYDTAKNTAATGGLTAPSQPTQMAPTATPPDQQGPLVGADEVPNLGDPTMRPNEPITAGLNIGAGGGREALGNMPPPNSGVDPVRQAVETLFMLAPSPDLSRILGRLDLEGR